MDEIPLEVHAELTSLKKQLADCEERFESIMVWAHQVAKDWQAETGEPVPEAWQSFLAYVCDSLVIARPK